MKNIRNHAKAILFLFCVTTCLYLAVDAQTQAEPQALQPGQMIEREITGAETHRYKFDLKKGEFFQVRLEQKRVDVMLKLLSAEGKEVARMDTPTANEGPEVLTWAAASDEVVILEISGFDPKAEKGAYALKRLESRVATALDKRRIEVERIFIEGMTARDTDGQIELAIKKLTEAKNGWQEIKDDYMGRTSLYQINALKKIKADASFDEGRALEENGTAASLKAALEKYREANRIYTEIDDTTDNAGNSLFHSGFILRSMGNSKEALGFLEQALKFFQDHKFRELEASTFNQLGLTHSSLGNPTYALELFNRALDIHRETKNNIGEAATLNSIGQIYGDRGENKKALECFSQVLRIVRSTGFKYGEAVTLNNIAHIYYQLGDARKALENLNESLALRRVIGDKKGEGRTLTGLGEVYLFLGDNEQAIIHFNQALPLSRLVGDKENEYGTLNNLGSIHHSTGDFESALKNYNESLRFDRESGNKESEAISLHNVGGVYSSKGDKKKALELYQDAMLILRQIGARNLEATALRSMCAAYFDLGEKGKAIEACNLSLIHSDQTGDTAGEAISMSSLSSIWESLEKTDLAIFYGKRAVNKYQELRLRINSLDKKIQKTYLTSVSSSYRKLADILIRRGKFAQAERVLAMLKDEEYFDFVRRDGGEISKLDVRVTLNESEKGLITRYSALADKITEIGQEFTKLEDKKRQLSRSELALSPEEQKRYEELEKQLADANAAFQLFLTKELVAEIGKEKAAGIEIDRNLQAKLRKWGEGTVALYTVAGEDRYRVVLTTPKVQVDGKTEIKIADLNKKVFAFRVALQDPKIDPRPLGKELYDILIKPIEKELKAANAKTLIWSLDGTLRYIPLAALSPDGQRYLVEDYQNVILTPKTRDDLTVSNSQWKALGLGVSEGSSVTSPEDGTRKIPFSPLPGTERELFSIVSDDRSSNENGVLPGRRFLNKDFTLNNFKESLIKENADGKHSYNLVHIASHFHLGSNDTNSFILLGNGQILTLAEIRNSPAIDFGSIELITLSACNTGFADDTNGKEIDSLASIIQTKSGKSILATLWAVSDESTALLMSEFYRLRTENPKLTKADAMQLAQKAMIEGRLRPMTANGKNGITGPTKGIELPGTAGANPNAPLFTVDKNRPYAHPYYWSPFILIGNWK